MGKNKSLKQPYPLILASTSKYRANLLSQLGWEFNSVSPDVDEAKFKSIGLTPEDIAIELSKLKARDVYNRFTNSCVIGSDQVCSLDKMILSKPGTRENAISQLLLMQGKSHNLLTAVTVISPVVETTFLNKTILHMRKLSIEDIENYIDDDRPLDCAGSYRLEAKGIKLFERIEMTDHTAIIGLPLIELSNLLISTGFPI